MKHTSSFSLSLEEKVKVNQLLFFSLPELKINRKGERENKEKDDSRRFGSRHASRKEGEDRSSHFHPFVEGEKSTYENWRGN